jgi:hypothetical protein
LTLNKRAIFQLFKYAVYLLLAMNIYWFFIEEHAAVDTQFAGGLRLFDVIEAYVATIDTAAWVILLLMFELETFVLDDEHFTPPVKWTLHGLRIVCYAFIVYACYGYVVTLFTQLDIATLAGVSNLCALSDGQWSYATTLDEYAVISAANCAELSSAASFLRFGDTFAIVDAVGYRDILVLAAVDVINSVVWILVVLVLEMDVRLQEKDKLEGPILTISTALKYALYSILFLAAVYWGLKGDFVDFWDAFLWLVAFFFIEMNVVEWRHEEAEEKAALAAA